METWDSYGFILSVNDDRCNLLLSCKYRENFFQCLKNIDVPHETTPYELMMYNNGFTIQAISNYYDLYVDVCPKSQGIIGGTFGDN